MQHKWGGKYISTNCVEPKYETEPKQIDSLDKNIISTTYLDYCSDCDIKHMRYIMCMRKQQVEHS